MADSLACREWCGGGRAGVAFVRARGGDSSDVVSTVFLHRFEMRRKKIKKKNLSKCPCGAKCVRRRGVCAKGQLEMKGTKDLLFFFEGEVPCMVSGGSLCVPTRHVRAGATGWLACPKRVI